MTDSFFDRLSPEDKEACIYDLHVFGAYCIKEIDGVVKHIHLSEVYREPKVNEIEGEDRR